MAATDPFEAIRPSDPSYETARRIHNGLIDKRPALIARCHSAAHVANAVKHAREADLEISVRGGGHNVAGKAVTDGGLMIDLSPMKQVTVDAPHQRATAGPGLTWNELNVETHRAGLATTGGVVSSTGIAGLTLGGGYGWLQGEYGMAVDNLISAEVVTAEGEVLRANDAENPDLFWALRGGGGNFGVVTEFEYRLHAVETVLGGLVVHPASSATDVLRGYGEVTARAPDELGVQFALITHPEAGKVAALGVCHCGEASRAEKEVRAVRSIGHPIADTVARVPYPDQNRMLDEGFPSGALNYWKSAFLTELSDAAGATLAACFDATPSAMTACIIEPMSGAASRVDPTATAYPHREQGYSLLLLTQWADPADTEANIAWTRETFEALRPFMADRRYVNYLSADDDRYVRQAYGQNYDRLVEIKRKYDGSNVFHLNQNIDPG